MGERKTKIINALFDSGAYKNYIRRVLYDQDNVEQIGFRAYQQTDFAILADGTSVPVEMIAFNQLHIGNITAPNPTFQIMEHLSWDLFHNRR